MVLSDFSPRALVAALLLLAACQPEQPAKQLTARPTALPLPDSSTSAVPRALSRMEQAHARLPGLLAAYRRRPQPALLDSLDRLCCRSDGELSTNCGIAAVELYAQSPALLAGYWFDHPRSCLENVFVNGYSEDLVLLSTTQRLAHLTALRQRVRKVRLPTPQAAYLQDVITKIDPSMYD